MKYGKMLLAALLAVVMMVSLCACAGGGTSDPDNKPDNNTTTTTTTTTTKVDDGKVTYTVTVKDDAGAPVAGVFVQLCKETCYPAATDANGVATWALEEDEYKVSFVMAPAGYTVEEAYYFEGDATDMIITIAKA